MIDLQQYAHLRPRRGTVFVKLFPAAAEWAPGIVRPDGYKERRPRRGVVVAIGPNAYAKSADFEKPVLKVTYPVPPKSAELHKLATEIYKSMSTGVAVDLSALPDGIKIKKLRPMYKPHLVQVGDEVLIVQWTLSLSKSGHPSEVTFSPFGQAGEEIVILDEYKDIHAVLEPGADVE